MNKIYKDVRYCGHCEKDTEQEVIDSEHERDSSGDWQHCLTCNWEYNGYTRKWEQEPWSG